MHPFDRWGAFFVSYAIKKTPARIALTLYVSSENISLTFNKAR